MGSGIICRDFIQGDTVQKLCSDIPLLESLCMGVKHGNGRPFPHQATVDGAKDAPKAGSDIVEMDSPPQTQGKGLNGTSAVKQHEDRAKHGLVLRFAHDLSKELHDWTRPCRQELFGIVTVRSRGVTMPHASNG